MMKFKGLSKYQIQKVILSDGREISLENVTHLLIAKESKDNYCISHNIIIEEDYRKLSNQCTMMAHVLKYMCQLDMSYIEAFNLYQKNLKYSKNRRDKN